jgi:hypothetical protein
MRPNRKVKCIVCDKTVHYAKTWYLEIDNTSGRACRYHNETINYRKQQQQLENEKEQLSLLLIKLLSRLSTITGVNAKTAYSKLKEVYAGALPKIKVPQENSFGDFIKTIILLWRLRKKIHNNIGG